MGDGGIPSRDAFDPLNPPKASPNHTKLALNQPEAHLLFQVQPKPKLLVMPWVLNRGAFC